MNLWYYLEYLPKVTPMFVVIIPTEPAVVKITSGRLSGSRDHSTSRGLVLQVGILIDSLQNALTPHGIC